MLSSNLNLLKVRASELLKELTKSRSEVMVAELCADYALLLIDSIPNDERWSVVGVPSHSECSFIIF